MATTSDLAKAWRGFMGHANALVSSLDSGSGAELGLRDRYCAAAGALTAAARDLGYNAWHEGLLPGFRQPPAESLAPKLRWLQALTQAGAPPWILSQLRAFPRLLDSLRQPNPRNRFRTPQAACRALNACNFTCEAACTALILAIKPLHSLDPVRHWVHVSKYGAPFADAAFLSALSRAARAAAEAAGGPEPPALGGLHPPALETWVELCTVLSKTAAYCLNLAAIILEAHLAPLRRPPDGSTAGSASEAVRLPAVVPRLAQALRDSELAAGLARACFASVGPRPELPPGWAGNAASASGHALGPCRGSGGAAAAATAGSRRPGRPWSVEAWLYAGAVGLLTTALLAMHARQEPALVQVRTALADLLGHDDVAAMRLALLQSLWRQGGVGPGPSAASAGGGGGGGGGVLGGGGGDGDDGGGEGGSGDLALLWEHHERVLKATVGLWQVAAVGMAAVRNGGSLPLEPRVPAGEQLARAAARTAEALQRIRRSWIPGGVSNSGQAWSLPVPVSESLSFLLPFDDTERRIQPGSAEQGYWAESAARLLPGTTEALELCLAEPESDATLPRLKTAASNAARVVGALARLARGLEGISGPPHGSWSLSDDADLGAELDHALRLAFLATERVDVGRDRVDVGRGLEALQGPGGDLVRNALGVIVGQVPQAVAELGLTLVEETEAGAGPAAGGAGGAGAGGAAALGEGGGALLSCAKRAAGLAWRLEAAGTRAHAVCLGPTSLAPAAVLNTLCMFLWYREQRCRMRGPGEQGRGDLRAAAPPADPRAAAAATAGGGPAALAAAAAGPQAAAVADAAGGGGGTLEGELDAYVMQAAGSLAMQAAAATSLLVPTADTARSAELNLVRQAASNVVCFALRYAVGLCGTPAAPRATGSLPLARLLACQPHRLFSAGCKLLCAWAPAARPPATASPDRYAQWWTLLADVMPEALACLAAHPQLSGRVRRWLLVPTQPGRGVAGDAEAASAEGGSAAAAAAGAAAVCREERREGSGGAAACAGEEGCLGRVWAAAMRCRGAQDARHAWARSVCGSALQTAAQPGGGAGGGSGADGSAGGAGGGSGAGGSAGSAGGGNGGSEGPDPSEVDAAFRSVAQSLVDWMGRMGRSETLGSAVGPQPFREEFRRRAAAVLGTGTGMPEAERLAAAETQVEALMSPLPPPLAAPPEGRVLSRLRVCGNPGCCEFGGRSEGGLPLKQCGGCRAVRYCGGVCQRAHWRAGHKGECGDMAAAMAAAGERE